MIETSESIKALADALHGVQGEITGVSRNAANPFHKSKYANLEAVIAAVREPLQRHGVVFVQAPGVSSEGTQEVTTLLIHAKTGEWLQSTLTIPLAKQDPQGAGSAITYACRYSLMAMLGVPPVDDDGEIAMGRANPNGSATHPHREQIPDLIEELKKTKTEAELAQWGMDNAERIGNAAGVKARLKEAYTSHMSKVKGGSARDATPYAERKV